MNRVTTPARQADRDKSPPAMNPGHILTNRHGSILVGLIVIFTVLSMLMVAMMRLSTTATYNELFANRQDRANSLAEAGGRYGIKMIEAGLDPDGTYTLTAGNTFSLNRNIPGDGYVYLESRGRVNSGTDDDWLEAKATITFRIPPPPPETDEYFEYVIFANSTATDAIYVANSPTVLGEYGTNGQVELASPVVDRRFDDSEPTENAQLVLDPPPAPPSYPAPDQVIEIIDIPWNMVVTLDAGSYSWNTINMNVNDQVILNDGVTLVADTINLLNTSHMDISGNVTLVVSQITVAGGCQLNISAGNLTLIADNLCFKDFSDINIDADSSMTVFVNNQASFIGGTDTNTVLPTASAKQFTLYGSNTCLNISFEDGIEFLGTVYAPYTHLDFMNGAFSTGTFIGNQIDIIGTTHIHYPVPPEEPIIQYFSAH